MRGTIENYDDASGQGAITAKSGQTYLFSRSSLLARSQTPNPGSRVVFRLKNGKVFKAVVFAAPRTWRSEIDFVGFIVEAIFRVIGEILIRLPFAMLE